MMLAQASTGNTGSYQLLRRIGSGGMAEATLARQVGRSGFERLVVLKRMLPHVTSDPDFVRMFLDEARLMARLTHPNIVQVLDIGEISGTPFMALEYIRGVTLAELLDKAQSEGVKLPPSVGARIVSEICAALHYAYQCPGNDGTPLRVVHRDLSPQNVMVSFDGAIKLMDFGIAKAANQEERTRTGVIKGKAAYMSPEQVQGHPLDQRSDIFAAGILLFESTTGQRLFETQNEYEIIRSVVEGRLRSPSAVVREYPAELERVWRKATATARRRRYADARAMQLALEQYLTAVAALSAALTLPQLLVRLFPSEKEEAAKIGEAQRDASMDLLSAEAVAAPGDGRRAAEFSAAGSEMKLSFSVPRRTRVIGGLALTAFIAIATGVLTWGRADTVALAPPPELDWGRTWPRQAPPPEPKPELEAPPPAPSGGTEPSAAAPEVASVRVPRRGARRTPAKSAAQKSAVAPKQGSSNVTVATAGLGYLTVTSKPWGTISLDGKDFGETPIARVPIAAGIHEVIVASPQTGRRERRQVAVKNGAVTVINFNLDEPKGATELR